MYVVQTTSGRSSETLHRVVALPTRSMLEMSGAGCRPRPCCSLATAPARAESGRGLKHQPRRHHQPSVIASNDDRGERQRPAQGCHKTHDRPRARAVPVRPPARNPCGTNARPWRNRCPCIIHQRPGAKCGPTMGDGPQRQRRKKSASLRKAPCRATVKSSGPAARPARCQRAAAMTRLR